MRNFIFKYTFISQHKSVIYYRLGYLSFNLSIQSAQVRNALITGILTNYSSFVQSIVSNFRIEACIAGACPNGFAAVARKRPAYPRGVISVHRPGIEAELVAYQWDAERAEGQKDAETRHLALDIRRAYY